MFTGLNTFIFQFFIFHPQPIYDLNVLILLCFKSVKEKWITEMWINCFVLLPNWQESQAVPLTNINSVMAEANSGKTTRRLHFQDELPTGTTESPTETGHTHTHTHTHTHLNTFCPVFVETYPMLALHFTINRWYKGQPFKQLQEAAIRSDAHRLRRWVLDISIHQMAYVCIHFLNRLIRVTDLKTRTHTHP